MWRCIHAPFEKGLKIKVLKVNEKGWKIKVLKVKWEWGKLVFLVVYKGKW